MGWLLARWGVPDQPQPGAVVGRDCLEGSGSCRPGYGPREASGRDFLTLTCEGARIPVRRPRGPRRLRTPRRGPHTPAVLHGLLTQTEVRAPTTRSPSRRIGT